MFSKGTASWFFREYSIQFTLRSLAALECSDSSKQIPILIKSKNRPTGDGIFKQVQIYIYYIFIKYLNTVIWAKNTVICLAYNCTQHKYIRKVAVRLIYFLFFFFFLSTCGLWCHQAFIKINPHVQGSNIANIHHRPHICISQFQDSTTFFICWFVLKCIWCWKELGCLRDGSLLLFWLLIPHIASTVSTYTDSYFYPLCPNPYGRNCFGGLDLPFSALAGSA